MNCTFQQPPWAVIGTLIVLVALTLLWRTQSARSWRWRFAITLPLLAAAAISFALAKPQLTSPTARGVILLLDLSDSTRNSPWRDPAWVRKLAETHLGADRPLTLLAFAATPWPLINNATPGDAQSWPLAWPSPPSPTSTQYTDLNAALDWRSPAEHAGKGLAPRWIITDGLLPAPAYPSPFPLACTILPPETHDVGVQELLVRKMPPQNETNASPGTEVLVKLRAAGILQNLPNAALHLILHIHRDGIALPDASVVFDPPAEQFSRDATRWISIRDPQADGNVLHHYHVSVQSTPPDPWPENDTAEILWTPAEDQPHVLVISDAPSPALAGWPGVVSLRTDHFSADAAQLAAQGWQAIILDDVPALGPSPQNHAILQPGAQQAINRFVRETGGGLLLIGRGHAFAPGNYGEPSGELLEALSPFWSRPHAANGFHIIFLLDASGSMNDQVAGEAGGERKFRLLAQGVISAAEMLAADDRLTIITFNSHAQTIVDGNAEKTVPTLPELLSHASPTGPTIPDTVLEPLVTALRDNPVNRQTCVILVTDGEIPSIDISRWEAILQPSEKSPARLVIIAPTAAMLGPPDKPTTLQKLTTQLPGTQKWQNDDAHTWTGLLRQVIGEQVNGRRHAAPIAWQMVPPLPSATGDASAWTDVWLKSEARRLAEGNVAGSPPLAGIVQRGLGQVAAIALEDDANGSAYRILITEMLRRISAAPGDRRFTITAHRDPDGGWRLAADGNDAQNFLNHETLEAHLLTDSRAIPLIQTAPGYYEARIHATSQAPLVGTIVRTSSATTPEQFIGRFQTPAIATAEYPATVTHTLSTRDLASIDGAIELPASPNDPALWNPPATATSSLAFYLWGIAAIFALVALWIRP